MRRKKTATRRKRSPAGALLRFWIAFAVVFAAAAGGAYFAATWSGFDARSVAVTGNVVVSKQAILQAAGIVGGGNVWLQNTNAAAKRVERIPYVDRAWIHRRPPAAVWIAVRERTPFAVVQAGGASAIVDRNLRVLSLDPPASALPVLVTEHAVALAPGAFLQDGQITALRDDVAALTAARVRVARLSFDRYDDLSALLSNGVTVLFGDADLAKKIPLIDPILAQLAHGRPFRALDLRALDAPVVVYR